MRTLSADAALQHGLNPSANFIDQLHAHLSTSPDRHGCRVIGPQFAVSAAPRNASSTEILPAIQEVFASAIVRFIDVLLAVRVGHDPARVLHG